MVAVAGDVADARHRGELVAAAQALGGPDLLVNNASLLGPSPQPSLADYPLDDFAAVYAVNVTAPLGLIQLALPLLAQSPQGRILNITSDAGVEGYEGWGGYGSSKAALEQLVDGAGRRATHPAGVVGRPGRHAHPDAPGGLPRRGHLRPAADPRTASPGCSG